jgi:putative transposase
MVKVSFKRHRFPPEIIQHAVWLYARLTLSFAIREERLSAVHDQGLRTNNRTENSHQPVRRRERKQQRFKSAGSAQRFLSIHAAVYNAFYVQRHLLSRCIFKEFRAKTFAVWRKGWLAA